MVPAHFPVAIVGAGPTGLTLANLLGRYGVATLLLERHAATVGEPRAVSIDDESLRTLQNAGLLEAVLPDLVLGYGVHYYSWAGREFARVLPTSREYGHPKRNAFRQPLLEAALLDGLARFAHVEVRLATELSRHHDDGARVILDTRGPAGPARFTCDWLVACDGGRSGVREALGVAMRGTTFAERWLIVDLAGREDGFAHTRTYCDPVRPAIRLPGPQRTLRYEFMLFDHERTEEAVDEQRIRAWMGARVAGDAHLAIVRKVVYTFHARIAERWKAGRVMLAGDAAHLSPPFAGQGMNSGVRDAFNLAWKLAAVSQGRLGPELLESYERERKPHAWSLIVMALRIGRFMQPKSKPAAMAMQAALRIAGWYRPARDYVLHLKFKPRPRFARGFFLPRHRRNGVRAGELFPQPAVELGDGSRILLDELLGTGFSCIASAGDEAARRALEALAAFAPRRIGFVAPGAASAGSGTSGMTLVVDAEGVLARTLREAGAAAVILRPDRYVLAYLGAADPLADLDGVRALLGAGD